MRLTPSSSAVIMSKLDAKTSSEDAMSTKMREVYCFWNNKGGTGKTSLVFQAICRYANKHKKERVLAVDLCPQANLSELLLGGLTNDGSAHLLARQGETIRATIGGYFQLRLPSPYTAPPFMAHDFMTSPSDYNNKIPKNITLVCGDPLLELQSNAMNTLANAQIPGTNTWIAILDWLKQFIDKVKREFDIVFIDANPSFSIYTQIGLATSTRLVLPVMADDSSRRAVQNAFSLIYGFKLPSEIYASYAFATKLKDAARKLPLVHLVAKNRLTQYMGPASAYKAVLSSIDKDVGDLLKTHPKTFSFSDVKDGVVEIRDFQTSGVVSFAKGCPLYCLPSGKLEIGGRRVNVKPEYLKNCVDAVDALVAAL
jgi:cellulose biosynthesis protein BcsQ